MSRSIRNPSAYQDSIRRAAREREQVAAARLAEAIAPGRVLEVDGARWEVRVHRDELGNVTAYATLPGLTEARATVLRTERPADESELARMLEIELRAAIEDRAERLLEVADLMRRGRSALHSELRELVVALYADDKARTRQIRHAARELVERGETDERITRLAELVDP